MTEQNDNGVGETGAPTGDSPEATDGSQPTGTRSAGTRPDQGPDEGQVSGPDTPDRPFVVVGVDGSEDGMRAVDYGVHEAAALDADLLLAHAVDDAVLAGAWGVVYDPGLLQDSGQEAASAARERAIATGADPERVRAEVYLGNPAAVMSKLSVDACTVVVGRRAMGGLERLFVGSTSVGIAATSECPVIVVSAASHPNRTGGLHTIGVGLDVSSRGQEPLEYAFSEAARRGSTLKIVHSFEVPSGWFSDTSRSDERADALRLAAEEESAKLITACEKDFPEVEYSFEIVRNHPVAELTERSREVDLLVLGVHGSAFPGFSPGATARALMAHSECPLAMVRHAKRSKSAPAA